VEKADLTPESIEEIRATERSLLLGEAELSLLKAEAEAKVTPPKKLKDRGQRVSDTSHISATPAKKKKGGPGGTDTSVPPVTTKRKATSADLDTSTVSFKKAKGS